MIINICKEKDPIAVWWQKEKPKIASMDFPLYNTYGWNEFIELTNRLNLTHEVSAYKNWLQNNLQFGRKELTIGEYFIVDGRHELHKRINKNGVLNCANTKFILEKDGFVWITLGNNLTKSLFFTAQKKYRNFILSGKQPIRSTEFYRKITNHSGDRCEGYSYNDDIETAKITNCLIGKSSFEGYIFSLHDSNIGSDEKTKFGDDTYEIIDLNQWIFKIYNQINSFLLRNKQNYIGSIVAFGKVNYQDVGNKMNNENAIDRIIPDYLKNCHFQDLSFLETQIPEDFFETLTTDHFSKPTKYKAECEYRLSIIPLFFSNDNSGFLSNERDIKFDIEIWMNVSDYDKVIKLYK